jgi:hypothetical protein
MSAETLFNTIRLEGGHMSDASLRCLLGIGQAFLSKMRRGSKGVSAGTIIKIHEETGMSIARIKELLASDAVVTLPPRQNIVRVAASRKRTPRKQASQKVEQQKPTSFVHRCL